MVMLTEQLGDTRTLILTMKTIVVHNGVDAGWRVVITTVSHRSAQTSSCAATGVRVGAEKTGTQQQHCRLAYGEYSSRVKVLRHTLRWFHPAEQEPSGGLI